MEWFGFALVGVVVFFWWLGRGPSQPAPPVSHRPAAGEQARDGAGPGARTAAAGAGVGLLGAEVLRRATDMNDPDGTFMDGYVAGRLTERAEGGDEQDSLAAREEREGFDVPHRWSGADNETWEESDDLMGDGADDMPDDW